MKNEILTSRARLIPFVAEHIPQIVKMWKEPDSNKFIEPLLNMSEEMYYEKLESNIGENETELKFWSVFHRENNEFIGTLNLNVFNLTGQDQLGVHLARDYWNKGYAHELCEAILIYAAEVRKLNVLHWVYEAGHDVSEKLALSLGFEPFEEIMDGDCPLRIYRKTLSQK